MKQINETESTVDLFYSCSVSPLILLFIYISFYMIVVILKLLLLLLLAVLFVLKGILMMDFLRTDSPWLFDVRATQYNNIIHAHFAKTFNRLRHILFDWIKDSNEKATPNNNNKQTNEQTNNNCNNEMLLHVSGVNANSIQGSETSEKKQVREESTSEREREKDEGEQ